MDSVLGKLMDEMKKSGIGGASFIAGKPKQTKKLQALAESRTHPAAGHIADPLPALLAAFILASTELLTSTPSGDTASELAKARNVAREAFETAIKVRMTDKKQKVTNSELVMGSIFGDFSKAFDDSNFRLIGAGYADVLEMKPERDGVKWKANVVSVM